MGTQPHEQDAAQDDSTREDLTRGSPFRDEALIMTDPALQTDEISKVQTEAEGAARESGEHLERLLYPSSTEYVYDPRSSRRGVQYSPGAASGTGEQQT